MNETCSIVGKCRNRETKELSNKKSQLHRDLLSLGKINRWWNRQRANRAFFLSRSPKFWNKYEDTLVFDGNDAEAEPALASFFEIARETVMKGVTVGDIRSLLNKKYREGDYSYEEAYDKMISFNKEKLGANTFMATIYPSSDGKYHFEIVGNTDKAQQDLIQTIADKQLYDDIITRLKENGVAVTDGVESCYKIKGAKTVANGLMGLIELKQGNKVVKDLASETGHFIIDAMGLDHPLVQRLSNVITNHPEIVQELLGEAEYEQYKYNKNAQLEFLGHLVGLYLEQYDTKDKGILSSLSYIIQKAVDWLGKTFAIFDRDYKKAMYDAKYAAHDLASQFMGDSFKGTLSEALKANHDTLYGDSDIVFGHLKNMISQLHILVEQSKDFGLNSYKSYNDRFKEAFTSLNSLRLRRQELRDSGQFYDMIELESEAVEQIAQMARFVSGRLSQSANDMQKILSSPIVDYAEASKVVKQADEVYKLAQQLVSVQDDLVTHTDNEELKASVKSVMDLLSKTMLGFSYELQTEDDSIETHNYSFAAAIYDCRRKIATSLLVDVNGSQFLAIEQHVTLKGLKVVRHGFGYVDLVDEVIHTETNPPASWYNRMIDAMADSPDKLNQIIAQAVEQRKQVANVKTLEARAKLLNLMQTMKAHGIRDTRELMELDDSGKITGNIISERNWGQWELDFKEAKKKFDDEFYERNKDQFPSRRDMYSDAQYYIAFGAFRDGWHMVHSVKIEVRDIKGNIVTDRDSGKKLKVYAPKIETFKEKDGRERSYFNPKFSEIKRDPKKFEWYKSLMEMKQELDALLPQGCTNAFGVRAPQFRGTFTDRMTNLLHGDNTLGRVSQSAFRGAITYQLSKSPEDTEYGGEHDTYDNEDLDCSEGTIFTRAHSNALKSIQRVPLYGVKKIPSDECSTDLLYSMLAYASMAYSYDALEKVSGAIEQSMYSLRERRVKNDRPNSSLRINQTPASYLRLEDYIQQQIYNNYNDAQHSAMNIAMRKLMGKVAGLGQLVFLGWNNHSAIVNKITGLNNIIKEAFAGEDFNVRDVLWAMWTYRKYFYCHIAGDIWNAVMRKGSDVEVFDRFNCIMDRLDYQNENERKFKNWHVQTKGHVATDGMSYTSMAMFPYTITDKWMQAIAYLSSLKHTKVYKDGERISLWKAYDIKDNVATLNGVSIIDTNREAVKDVLHRKESNGATLSSDERKILSEPSLVPFDDKQETLFKTKCRGINDRLHGVYNKGDGGAYLGYAIGPAAASLKKYAIGLIEDRFSRSKYDIRGRRHRQGFYTTIVDLLADCMFSSNIPGNSRWISSLEYVKRDNRGDVKVIATGFSALGRIVLGLAGFMCISLHMGWNTKTLSQMGYSRNQICNIRRFWGDQIIPILILGAMRLTEPPEKDDYENPWLAEASDWLTGKYSDILNSKVVSFFADDLTTDDEWYLSKEGLEDATYNTRSIPFSVKGMIYYFAYRAYMEQIAFSPTAFVGEGVMTGDWNMPGYSMFREWRSLTSTSLPGLSAIVDVWNLVGEHASINEDELIRREEDGENMNAWMSSVDNPDVYRQAYQQGPNEGWYKWSKRAIRLSPLRSAEVLMNGYKAKNSMDFWNNIGQKK